MTTFIYIPGGLEQVWACISGLHFYCNYLGMIKAQFLISQRFEMIKKNEKRHIRKPPPPKRQNDVIKDKIDS